jgi:tetratricopeptide (TPR) repeat protein
MTRRTRPWLLFGWLWVLGTLVPVIGLVQVGAQSMADRYMYVPMLGLATALVWGGAELAQAWPKVRKLLCAASAVALLASGYSTARQVSAWRSSTTLYERSIAAGEDNAAIRYLLAQAYRTSGRPEADVEAQYRAALALSPDYVNALTQLVNIALAHERMDEAQALVEECVRFEPDNPNMYVNRAAVKLSRGLGEEAIHDLELALKLDPRLAKAHSELGQLHLDLDRMEEGRIQFEISASLLPWDTEAQCDYGTLLCNTGRLEASLPFLERAVWLNPLHERARKNLELVRTALRQKGPAR